MLNHGSAAGVFGALGDATRRSIISQLADGPATVSELAIPLNISRSAVLQHLQVLEDSRLIRSHKSGRIRTCELDLAGLQAASDWLDWHQRRWARRLDRLGELLDND